MSYKLIIAIIMIISIHSHEKIVKKIGTYYVKGAINTYNAIDLREKIQYIHTAQTVLPQDQKYIHVMQSSITPLYDGQSSQYILPSKGQTLLEQLRNFQSSSYIDMVIFQNVVFLHLLPNKIVIVNEKYVFGFGGMGMQNRASFIENTYTIDQLTSRVETKMYKVKNGDQTQVLLTTNTNIIYKLDRKQYQRFAMKQRFQASHLQFINDNVFIASQYQKGIGLYKIQSSEIQRKRIYICQQLLNKGRTSNNDGEQQEIQITKKAVEEQPLCSIQDINFNITDHKIYFLEQNTGLYQAQMSQFEHQDYTLSKFQLIKDAKGCNALDMASQNYIVLICQIGSQNSYIQQLVRYPDPIFLNKTVLVKKDPIYHRSNFNDVRVTENFFLAFNTYNVEIFWNQAVVGITQNSQVSKQRFNLPGLSVFGLKFVKGINNNPDDIYVYVVQSNQLRKFRLNIFKGGIYVNSAQPVRKQLKVHIPRKCSEDQSSFLTNNRQINNDKLCIYELDVIMEIDQFYQSVSRQKVSMSIGLIILMLIIIIILTWICLAKYRGLQNHAKRLLQKYKNKQKYKQNVFRI